MASTCLLKGARPKDRDGYLMHDLAQDVRHDADWPYRSDHLPDFWNHLENCGACTGAKEALLIAWREYSRVDLTGFLDHSLQQWVLLKCQRSSGSEFPYHIEPLERYLHDAPHYRWTLLSVHDGASSAYKAMRDDIRKEQCSVTAQSWGPKLRFQILRRDGYRCCICGREPKDGICLEVDHRVPKAYGGSDEPDNLWTLCDECNRGKGTLPLATSGR